MWTPTTSSFTTKGVIFAAASLLLLSTHAGALSLEEDAQLWAPLFINVPAQGRLVGLLELQPRVRGDFGRLTTGIVRPWVGWRVAPATFLHAGYGWIRSDTTRVTVEHRVWQQFQLSGSPAPGWTLTGRARVEQRSLQGVSQTAWRARSFARVERALGGGARYVVAYDEAFVHLNSPNQGPRAGFDQNRAFLGLGKSGERAKIEGGYQFVWVRRIGRADDYIHALVVNAFLWPWGR